MTADLIRHILIADPVVFGLVGFSYGNPAQKEIRCYRSSFPNGVQMPCLTYHDITGEKVKPKRYLSFTVTAWGGDESECQILAQAVEDALDEYFGEIDGIEIDGIELSDFKDAFEEPNTGLWYSFRSFEMIFGGN